MIQWLISPTILFLGVPEYDDRPYDNSYNSSQAWSMTEVWRFD